MRELGENRECALKRGGLLEARWADLCFARRLAHSTDTATKAGAVLIT